MLQEATTVSGHYWQREFPVSSSIHDADHVEVTAKSEARRSDSNDGWTLNGRGWIIRVLPVQFSFLNSFLPLHHHYFFFFSFFFFSSSVYLSPFIFPSLFISVPGNKSRRGAHQPNR